MLAGHEDGILGMVSNHPQVLKRQPSVGKGYATVPTLVSQLFVCLDREPVRACSGER